MGTSEKILETLQGISEKLDKLIADQTLDANKVAEALAAAIHSEYYLVFMI